MISQKLQQKLQQKLSPQQIVLMRLLQVPTIALEQTIKEEIEKNPMLEEDESSTSDDINSDEIKSESETDNDENEDHFDISDYMSDDETPAYKLNSGNHQGNEEQREIAFSGAKSFQEYLNEQLNLQDLTEREKLIGTELIGNFDDSGYLERDIKAMVNDFMLRQNIETTAKEIESVLKIIQSLDPPGIGARSLQECMLIQLNRIEGKTPAVETAIAVLQNHFESFVRKHYDKICLQMNISEQELKDALDEIVKLNPKPGNSILETEQTASYIIPDFYVFSNNGEIEFSLNSKSVPELKLSRYYSDMLQNMGETKNKTREQKETIHFIKEKMDSAKWFIDAIKQRNQTLENTMQSIIDYQHDFFVNGDINKLRPMRLKEISEMTGMDISTISRVVNQKYVQTHFGTFLLRDFFSQSFQNDDGEDIATDLIRHLLLECIQNEDKENPLTDAELKDLLNQKGYPVARRTVAKYREMLKIPVGRLRKEIKIHGDAEVAE